jgi:hypothetical protein
MRRLERTEAGSYAESKAEGGIQRRRKPDRRRRYYIEIGGARRIHERGLEMRFGVMVAQNIEAVRLF